MAQEVLTTPPTQSSVEAPETLTQAVHRLAVTYQQPEALIKRLIKCEAQKYTYQKTKTSEPLEVDGTTYYIDLNGTHKNINTEGEWWSTDYGPLMVNDYYHEAEMRRMGLSITKWQNSLEFGIRVMLKNEGTQPWSASKACWSK